MTNSQEQREIGLDMACTLLALLYLCKYPARTASMSAAQLLYILQCMCNFR